MDEVLEVGRDQCWSLTACPLSIVKRQICTDLIAV
jgi:hypothetical protein